MVKSGFRWPAICLLRTPNQAVRQRDWDSVTGSVIAVAKEGVRVLQEIMPGAKKAAPPRRGKRRGRPPGSRNKKPKAAAEGTAEGQAAATPKRRGRPKKAAS
jgi:hypothetical protein